MAINHYYRAQKTPSKLITETKSTLKRRGLENDSNKIEKIEVELCFNVETESSTLTNDERERLEWLLRETFDQSGLLFEKSTFKEVNDTETLTLEFGPRLTFASAFSSNAISICQACGISNIVRFERSRRYRFTTSSPMSLLAINTLTAMLHDRMTEEIYLRPIDTFSPQSIEIAPVHIIPLLEDGISALKDFNDQNGLGLDEFDLKYYADVFKSKLGRNPTDVECFDMGQSNSEHSRHWFFGGKMVLNGETMPETLFSMVKKTLSERNSDNKSSENNSVIAFHDNSSAIKGYLCDSMVPSSVGSACPMVIERNRTLHPILTAETHNFPCGVAPFPGAETGTGGRLRDVMATGRGAYTVAGISSYCVGNLHIPGYEQPWEVEKEYPDNKFAIPLDILLEASHGASDYGNKFGEPVVQGFTRTFGQRLPHGDRIEWIKPIMFTAGIGMIDDNHTRKIEPQPGMLVVKIGGPAYKIGIGGGAASSKLSDVDENETENNELDFNAVQRGDAEMGNRLNRLIRACCDLLHQNPILSVHDQGAGGNGNVLKEIVEPLGAEYDVRKILVGDASMSVLEIWVSEYQENNALLLSPDQLDLLDKISKRERCPYRVLGKVMNHGRVVLHDSESADKSIVPVDLPLSLVLGDDMPQKTFVDEKVVVPLKDLQLPDACTVMDALDRVLRLVSVGSKGFLVHKVDRSVTGLIAQQQCVGPLQLPLSNVAVVAHSYSGTSTGTATAVGERPLIGLVDVSAMAFQTVAEAMTNLVWAPWSSIFHIKASANWMWAAKLEGEACRMYEACSAMRDSLLSLGVAIDGGKDSLSMASNCGKEVVKAPGTLTLTLYVTCPDIHKVVTPDLKCNSIGSTTTLLYVDLSSHNEMAKPRTGGSALAQVFNQVGKEAPKVMDWSKFKAALLVTQKLIQEEKILSGHDCSDGGLIVTLLEMAFAGNCGLKITMPHHSDKVEMLFAEESGLVLEILTENVSEIMNSYSTLGVKCLNIGNSMPEEDIISIYVGEAECLSEKMTYLRETWEETSFVLEKYQRNVSCVEQEIKHSTTRVSPQWYLSYTPSPTPLTLKNRHRVAILREEGSNGDREMSAAFMEAGLEAWDVTVQDLLNGSLTLDRFQGLALVGGFSFADVLDSGKGWAGVIRFSSKLKDQFDAFRKRSDTFSLGVCNGCQLMALLGWVPYYDDHADDDELTQPRFVQNQSERFESRFISVHIEENSPAVLLKGMGGSTLGVWVANGEGRAYFPDSNKKAKLLDDGLAPIRYVNGEGKVTEEYPFNPSGSSCGIAALCSKDGRHLAMMPHPERLFLPWQWPWIPTSWKKSGSTNDFISPWLKLFQNARLYCDSLEK